MFSNFWFKKSISKESFFIFQEKPPQKPPEGEKKTKEKEDKGKSKDNPERFKKGRAKQADKTAEELVTPPEKKLDKKPTKEYLILKAFIEALAKKESPETLERLRKKAESDEVTLIELQGGHKWLDITEQENIKHPNKKYLKLSQMYLDLQEDKKTGETTLAVKQELDRNHKTKFGIGATTLLPPTFKTIEISTDNGQTLGKGIRSINPENGRIGYYQMKADGTPDYGKYLPIFSGYKIKPLTFIDENSDEYKKNTAAEKQNFENKAKAAKEYERAVGTTERDVRQYAGRRDYPISTLQSLRTKTPAELAKKVAAVEVEKIARAKVDLNKIESLLGRFGLSMDSRSEIDGGLYLVGLDGKGAEMLGWNSNCENLQQDWLKKLKDKDYIQKNTKDGKLTLSWSTSLQATLEVKLSDGKYTFLDSSGKKIENLEKWIMNYSAKLAEENPTVELIKAMQNGHKFKGFEFAGGYELNLSHLLKLNNLANNESEIVAKLNQIRQKEYPIRARTLIESLFNQGGRTLSLEEAKRFVLDNNMSPLISGNTTLANLYRQSNKSPTTYVNYNWNTHSGSLNHPVGGGEKCCARMVSDILGLQTSQGGREAVVSHLVSRIMKGNEAKTGNAGIVFGFENFQKGDVVVWQTYKKELGKRTFAHVGIIRDTINIDGQKFIAIQHDASNIQVDLVPVSKGTSISSIANEFGRNRHALAARQNPEDQAKLESIFTYRSSHPGTVHIRQNAGWWGDGSKNGGDIAMAVRTTTLSNEAPLVADSTPEVIPSTPAAPSTPRAPATAPTTTIPSASVTKSDETPTSTPHSPSTLSEELIANFKKNIEKIVENMKGTIAVNIFDPDTGQYLVQVNENKILRSASLIKVPILFALHKAVKLGNVAKKDVPRLMKHAEKMITVSNNYSTNEIIKYLGMEWINESIQELGLKNTKLESLMDAKAPGENTTTAEDMRKAMTLALSQYPPSGWPSAMDLMQINGHTGTLGEMLPQDVKIARKCGQLNQPRVEHYAAVYTIGKKKFVMVVMVSDFATREKAKEGIRKIGMLVYDALKQKTLSPLIANS